MKISRFFVYLKLILILTLCSAIFITFIIPPEHSYALSKTGVCKQAMLSPRVLMSNGQLYPLYIKLSKKIDPPFILDSLKLSDKDNAQLIKNIQYLNNLYIELQDKSTKAGELLAERILKNEELTNNVASLILAQDRMQKMPFGIIIDRKWAEVFKDHALAKAVATLDNRHIFFLQMEYELSTQFLINFREHLIRHYLMQEDGRTYEDRRKWANELAVYATGQIAKLQMAGGLGSFKPDLVRGGFYDALKKYWGPEKTRNSLHVMGIFYAKAIKGEGELVRDRKLDSVVEKIRSVKKIPGEKIKEKLARGESELVDVALENLEKVVTYKNISVNMNNIGSVDVTIYRNPYSELHEYWMYCPEVFHEAYPGNANDEFRTVQTFVYREVVVRYMQYLRKKGVIGDKIIISDSETSTALASPEVMSRDITRYPSEQVELYKNIFAMLNELDILYHHYNHTVVPAGMGTFPSWKFRDLKIKQEFRFIQEGEQLDLRGLAEIRDVVTGCSNLHTQIMRDHPALYKFFAHKIKEDDLFGNSEGSDIERWQGREIKSIINIYKEKIQAKTNDELFVALNKNPLEKEKFLTAVKIAKQMQKQRFIEELFKGTFGEIDVTREELEKDGINLLERPFFTFVRRMVQYKCSDFIIGMLEDKQLRERIVSSKAVIIIGGRKFDDFAESQHRRIKKLIEKDPRLKRNIIFISNHNVATSWMIQQGTDFGGMLSWKGMEAGPTSPSNAALNWTNLFSVLDGAMVERLRPIERDAKGDVIKGTGYIIQYGKKRADNEMRSRIPDEKSFLSELENASRNYFKEKDYDAVAFNNMWLNMTQGDIKTQASGLLRVWAKTIQDKQKNKDYWNTVIEKFVTSQSDKTIQKILCEGVDRTHDFYFGEGWPVGKITGGLETFVDGLTSNTEKGYIYKEAIHIVNYLEALLKFKQNNSAIFEVINRINGTTKYYSPLTYYEKQKQLAAFLKMLVERLKQGNKKNGSIPEIIYEEQQIQDNNLIAASI